MNSRTYLLLFSHSSL